MFSLALHALVLFAGGMSGGLSHVGSARNEMAIQLLEAPVRTNAPRMIEPQPVPRAEVVVQSTDAVAANDAQNSVANAGDQADCTDTDVVASLEDPLLEASANGSEASPVVVGGEASPFAANSTQFEAVPLSQGNQRPKYPRIARQRRWEGEVLVWVEVSPLGEVRQSGVEKTSGYGSLDRSALQAVQSWRFSPASLNGVFVESLVYVPIAFRLEKI